MDFEIKETRVEGGTLSLTVEVSPSAVEEAYSTVRKELSRYVRIPGFRKGKTPLNVLANHIGRERFQREIERELLPRYYYEAITESGHRPVSAVTYPEKTLVKGKPFVFTAEVAVAPEVKIGDYKGTKVTPPELEPVNDEAIQKRLDELRLRVATPEAKEGPAAEGDLVQGDIEGKLGDKAFPSLSRKQATLRIGDDAFFPGFDKNLVGLSAGDTKSFRVTAPDDVANPALQGKDVEFTVAVSSVRSVELPPVDEAFLERLGGRFKTVEELQGRIRTELEQEARKHVDEAYDLAIQDMLSELVEVDPPDSMVESRVEEKLHDFKEQFTNPYSFDDYLSEWNRTEEDVRAELREGAERVCKIEFALDEVAARESITATDEELAHRLRMLARVLRRSPMDVEEMIDSSGSRVLEKQKLTREKAFAWLKDRQAAS